MSTTIDTVRTRRGATSADRDAAGEPPLGRRIVDVSELDPEDIRQYARETDGRVHFERKGGRTFLVAG